MIYWWRICCRCASGRGYDAKRRDWCSVCNDVRIDVPEQIQQHAEFLGRVLDAREDGEIVVCSQCGYGMDDEDDDAHHENCPNRGRDRLTETMEFLAERLGTKAAGELLQRAVEDSAIREEARAIDDVGTVGAAEVTASRLQPGGDGPRYRATFSPQAWVNNHAISVDPQGPTEWDATEFVAAADHAWLAATLEHGDHDDILRLDPNAPEWVREWSGPFDTYLEEARDLAEAEKDAGGDAE